MRFTPFSGWMKKVLERELGIAKGEGEEREIREVVVETDGRSGDLVTSGFRRRMGVHCKFLCFISGPKGDGAMFIFDRHVEE